MNNKKAIIIGAGPAGLTAAYELLERTDIKPVLFEKDDIVGGIARTVSYKGNKFDFGGHRFFSKSDRITGWWLNILPLQGTGDSDRVMLKRSRFSRIYFRRKLFDYPISLNTNLFINLGIINVARIAVDYVRARLFPIKDEKSLEDFFINRFGRRLYSMLFKDYTEKVWGRSCRDIDPEWGHQRIKGLSVSRALLHAARKLISRNDSLSGKAAETSLIEEFMYPKYGCGQLWDEVGRIVSTNGGEIRLNREVTGVVHDDRRIQGVEVRDKKTGKTETVRGDYVFSTMPVKELVLAMGNTVPQNVQDVAEGLIYRDFMIVGILLNKLKIKNKAGNRAENDLIRDNWIYIQEKDVQVGRMQIYNNWSPWMVRDKDKVWIGAEYFCSKGDELWNLSDRSIAELAVKELSKINILEKEDVLDTVVERVRNAYPAYFGTYDRFNVIRKFTDGFDNLLLIGRNGMHRYNNMDHSMMTAIAAVDNIIENKPEKDNIWNINLEKDYHESD